MVGKWPKQEPTWLVPWVRHHLRLPGAARPKNAPAPIPQFAYDFQRWATWRHKGGDPAKRPDVTTDIPKWAWPTIARIWLAITPPSTITPLLDMSQNIVFCAQEPLRAKLAPLHFGIALSADVAYKQWATKEVVDEFLAQGRTKVFAWCDCMNTAPEQAKWMVKNLGLVDWIGQAETSSQLLVALQGGARSFVGNANNWSSDERAMVRRKIEAGEIAFMQETYANEGDPFPNATGTQGVPAASYVIGVYGTSRGYIPIPRYKNNTPLTSWPSIGLYHAAGVQSDEEWMYLPGS